MKKKNSHCNEAKQRKKVFFLLIIFLPTVPVSPSPDELWRTIFRTLVTVIFCERSCAYLFLYPFSVKFFLYFYRSPFRLFTFFVSLSSFPFPHFHTYAHVHTLDENTPASFFCFTSPLLPVPNIFFFNLLSFTKAGLISLILFYPHLSCFCFFFFISFSSSTLMILLYPFHPLLSNLNSAKRIRSPHRRNLY